MGIYTNPQGGGHAKSACQGLAGPAKALAPGTQRQCWLCKGGLSHLCGCSDRHQATSCTAHMQTAHCCQIYISLCVLAGQAVVQGCAAQPQNPRGQQAGRQMEPHLRAPAEVPTSTAVGAARPRAQGHATTSTLQASWRLSRRGAADPAAAEDATWDSTCTQKL